MLKSVLWRTFRREEVQRVKGVVTWLLIAAAILCTLPLDSRIYV